MDNPNSSMASEKRSSLKEAIGRDPLAADFRLSLFVSAARSFKYDSCLQPFPPDFVSSNKEKNIDELNRILESIQPLADLNVASLEGKSLDLLHWIICKQSNPGLRTVPKTDFDDVFAKAPCLAAFQRPQQIFEVVYREDAHSERRFRENQDQFSSYYAYHGSKLFNFYSILNYGLQQHLNKTALFGEGIYLSAELHVSQMFAPTGAGWARSDLGSHLACTALCQYIDNPSYVKCQEENSNTSDIPEKYILVKNNELVQVRYLLVYGSNRRKVASSEVSSNQPQWQQRVQPMMGERARPSRCVQWIAANKSWLMAGGYFMMLFAIGLMNNPNAHYMKQMFLQKINHVCNALFGGMNERDA
ncbi:protein mono-ADP-ribosyltransferase PARP16-like [Armigeres subalbatus]|uniref:protein mono-ADP-ribosyltransferase PARP16-like n=1 Tax=Armigeres subalbatus TaxID=124917 RepID=UPI002ECFB257